MASRSFPRRSRRLVRADDPVDISTPQTSTPSTSWLAKVPKEAMEHAIETLGTNIKAEDDDNKIRKKLNVVYTIVYDALEQVEGLEERLESKQAFRDNVKRKGEENFFLSLRAMAANHATQGSEAWEGLFQNEVFLKPTPAPSVAHTPPQEAVQLAWERVFKGEAARALLSTISSYMEKSRDENYSRHATIVNSSGTGKSRMVDQLAIEIITIPMCLRSERSTGYPRPDHELRNWLVRGEIKDDSGALDTIRKRLHGFVYALLDVTRITLQSIEGNNAEEPNSKDDVVHRQGILASAFRDRMTEGQSFQGPNTYRNDFYNKVMRVADASKFEKDSKAPGENSPYVWEEGDIGDAGKKLIRFIDPQAVMDRDNTEPQRPLVILAFDEAHIFTDNPSIAHRETKWTLFSELRRILRQTSEHAIFSLFLSTAGRFNLFSPEISSDPSLRIQNSKLSTLDPITEISFDDLAYPAPEYEIKLEKVVEIDWMCHLGRPLFGSLYDAARYRDKGDLMDLVKAKLLCGPARLENDRSGSLACLSVRFALDFNMDGTAGEVVRAQVERHMRLCLAATAGRDALVTLAGSEPLLAEAAYQLMKATQTNPVRHLADHSDLNCVDRGRRGELVAALLIMRACDAARAATPDHKSVPVDIFMRELLPQTKYDTLKESFPTFYRNDEKKTFAATFKGYGIWFNHVIKVENNKMISAVHLWKFITRGAMILCSNNQEGIDIVIPICHTKKPLSRHSVTAIVVQVKNAEAYQNRIDKTLFDGMDPIKLGLFPEEVPIASKLFPEDRRSKPVDPKPVIRIVFALAARETGVNFPEDRERDHHYPDKYTAFDIWCAGLSDEVFKHIDGPLDLASYQLLLERSLRPHDAFNLQDGHDETKKLRASLRRRMAPLTTTEDVAHHAVHLRTSAATSAA